MDSEVKKLAENTGNLRIKKKAPKNWCDLPKELKEEVVKRVDFKSSLRLRQTAHAERNLVDSRKFDFSQIIIMQEQSGNGGVFLWKNGKPPNDPSFILKKERCIETLSPFVAHILKVGNIKSLFVACDDNFVKEFMKTTKSFRIGNLQLAHPGLFDSAKLFVKIGKIETLSLSFHDHHSYFMIEADQYVRLCKTHGIKLAEIYLDKSLTRKELSEVFAAIVHETSLPGRSIVLRVKPNEAVVQIPVPGPLSNQLYRGPRFEFPVATGFSLPAMDDSKNIVFEVSEPQSDASGTWNEVTMRVV